MADSTIEVILRASAVGFPQAVGTAKQSLEQLGTSASGATTQLKSTALAGENLGNVLERSLFKSIGALSLIGAAAMEMKRAWGSLIEFYQSGIQYTAQFEQETHQLALELSALGRQHGAGYVQDLEYANEAIEKLHGSVASMGGDIKLAETMFHAFIAAGVVPDSDAAIQKIAQLNLVLSTMITSRRPLVAIQQEMLQLLDGEIGKNNQIANQLERQLGFTDKQLLNWVKTGIEVGDLPSKMAAALDPGKQAIADWENLLPQIQAQIKAVSDETKRSGMKEAYQDVTKAQKEWLNDLQTHKAQHAQAIANITSLVGDLTLAWNRATRALYDYVGLALSPNAPLSAGYSGKGPQDDMRDSRPPGHFILPSDRPPLATTQPGWGQTGRGGGGNEWLTIQRDLIGEAAQRAEALAGRIEDAAVREARLAAIHQKEANDYAYLAAHTADAAKAEGLRLRATQLTTQAINEQRQAVKDAAQEAKALVEAHVRASEEFLAHVRAMGISAPADQLAGQQRIQQYLSGVIQTGTGKGATADQQSAAQAALALRKGIDEQIVALRRSINAELTAANKAQLDEELKAVQDHMSDLEAAGQLSYDQKVALINQEIALVQNAEDQKLVAVKEATDQISTLRRELASAAVENARQEAEAAKQLSSEMERAYKGLMEPIDSATKAVTSSISSGFEKAFNDLIYGAQRGHSAILDLFQGIGKSIIAQTGKIISENITASLGLDKMLTGLFSGVSGATGGVKGSEDAQRRAQLIVAKAADTQSVAASVFQRAVVEFQAAVAALRGQSVSGGTTGPTGPFTNIPGVPPATGIPGTPSAQGTGPLSFASDILGIPQIQAAMGGGGIVSGALSLARLLFRGSGGLMPGSFMPVAAFAGGGVAYNPTIGIFAEQGAEAAIPLKNGKIPVDLGSRSGGDTHIYYINAIDSQSFEDAMHRNHRAVARVHARNMGLNDPNMRPGRGR